MSNTIDIQPVPGSEFLEKHSFPKFHQRDERIPKVRILPNDTLLVGIDFTNGQDFDVLIVGKKEGDYLHVVNAFQEKQARTIFDLLTLKEEDLKPWGEEAMNLVCPYCQSTFDDDLAWVHGEYRLPRYCPDCGHRIKQNTEETKNQHE